MKRTTLSRIISTAGVIFGFTGWWFTHIYLFINIAFIIIGLQSIYFSRDLAAESVARYDINPIFALGGYVVVGLVFVVANIVWMLKGVS